MRRNVIPQSNFRPQRMENLVPLAAPNAGVWPLRSHLAVPQAFMRWRGRARAGKLIDKRSDRPTIAGSREEAGETPAQADLQPSAPQPIHKSAKLPTHLASRAGPRARGLAKSRDGPTFAAASPTRRKCDDTDRSRSMPSAHIKANFPQIVVAVAVDVDYLHALARTSPMRDASRFIASASARSARHQAGSAATLDVRALLAAQPPVDQELEVLDSARDPGPCSRSRKNQRDYSSRAAQGDPEDPAKATIRHSESKSCAQARSGRPAEP